MQNNNKLLISKRSEFRNDFLQHSASIQAVQQKAEAAKKKVQREKEGTEMEVKKSGLNLDKSSRKGYIPPEHLSPKLPPGMKQAKNKGKVTESR